MNNSTKESFIKKIQYKSVPPEKYVFTPPKKSKGPADVIHSAPPSSPPIIKENKGLDNHLPTTKISLAPLQNKLPQKTETAMIPSPLPRKTQLPATNDIENKNEKSPSNSSEKLVQENIPQFTNEMDMVSKKAENQHIRVKPSEYLRSIARKKYGVGNTTIIDLIQMANPGVKDVNIIYPGQHIILPEITKEDLVTKDSAGNYHVHYASFYEFGSAQDTVGKLAKNDAVVFFVPMQQGNNLVYRVYLGMFKNQSDAVIYAKGLSYEFHPFL